MSLQPSLKPLDPAIVYTNEHGIVVVGPDKSCAAHLVAEVTYPGMRDGLVDPPDYEAYSPALGLTSKASGSLAAVGNLSSAVLDRLFHCMREQGNLDSALPGWSRSHHPRQDAEQIMHSFCQGFAESARAVVRFSLHDNTVHASVANLPMLGAIFADDDMDS